jgi:inosose dehydratase
MLDPRPGWATVKMAAGPICWGVCEVPGWGPQADPERVFGQMTALGLSATELGPTDWLPAAIPDARRILQAHDLRLVGGFAPLVLAHPWRRLVDEQAARMAQRLAALGGEVFIAAPTQDLDWSRPVPLDEDGWKRAGERLQALSEIVAAAGLRFVIHPHFGTLLETGQDIARALEHTSVPWCLDSGHLFLAGVDPADFVRSHGQRIGHVHLKDVAEVVAARLLRGRLSFVQAVQMGLFPPLGEGDVGIHTLIAELRACGYKRWLVLEQDITLAANHQADTPEPLNNVKRSIDFLHYCWEHAEPLTPTGTQSMQSPAIR